MGAPKGDEDNIGTEASDGIKEYGTSGSVGGAVGGEDRAPTTTYGSGTHPVTGTVYEGGQPVASKEGNTANPTPPAGTAFTKEQWDALPPEVQTLPGLRGFYADGILTIELVEYAQSKALEDKKAARDAKKDTEQEYLENQYRESYLGIWGKMPKDKLIKKWAEDPDTDLDDFIDAQRAKPRFKNTQTYRDEAMTAMDQLAEFLGMR